MVVRARNKDLVFIVEMGKPLQKILDLRERSIFGYVSSMNNHVAPRKQHIFMLSMGVTDEHRIHRYVG
jgi:hypothetical protein